MSTEDKHLKETTAKVMKQIRYYPYTHLHIGTRAALAFYEIVQALTILKARNPVLTAAKITLPHRVKSESLIDNEHIIKEIIESLNDSSLTQKEKTVTHKLPSSKIIQVLSELDRLQDMVYAMPYEIDILDPHWFKVGRESLFRAEAPNLLALTMNDEKEADFKIYQDILDDFQQKGLINIRSETIKFTQLGSFIKYTNVFNYIDRTYRQLFKSKSNYVPPSGDIRKYRRGDRYRNLHLRRTLRSLIKNNKNTYQISKEDLRIKEKSLKENCLVVLALDHSWSMARSRKLQYAKDAAAGLIFAVKRNSDQTALIAFSDEATILSPPTKQYGLLIEKITHLRPENETNISDTLVKTRMIFSSFGRNTLQHLFIITDGIPTSNNLNVTRKDLESKIIRELRKMRKMGITISVVCIRDELEENDTGLARKIALMGRGSFSLVNTQELLNQILRDYWDVKSKEMQK
jgi:Mg-chelatase subunit ChlD